MGHHCCSKQKVKRGLWSPEEDEKLINFITTNGHGCWSSVPKLAGLQRCGKSCRLRWINYLRPDLKRGNFSAQEERIIIDVHRILGNRWAQIAKHLPGRTDNEVKNFWNSCIKKKLISQGLDPKTHNLLPSSKPQNKTNPSNFGQFHQEMDTSATPFTISSNSKSFVSHEPIKTPPMEINSSFLTIPTSSTIQVPDNMTMPNAFQYQDSDVLMSFKDQNSNNSMDFGNVSSSMDHPHIAASFDQPVFIDETCMWSGAVDEAMGAPKQNGIMEATQGQQQQQQVQAQGMMCKMAYNEVNEGKGVNMETYNAANFDLGLMDPGLMHCGMFCNGNSMDQLHWDC